ncbi:hypothetical protein [Cellulosilyticum sp. I15G10I2]|uniref:hypothetical protein n=1 Tax=Cellulosilyticum sp. I15G10I2 TaxID=1892843 RepID=UPI00114D11BF|nr:hypothetical protein [Cellulosilyticum sp. I15G10I2]
MLIFMFTHLSLTTFTLPFDPVLPVAPDTAEPVSPIDHQRIMQEYINQIRTMHNRSFQLVQLTLDSPIRDIPSLRHSINLINIEIDSVRRQLRDYLSHVQTTRIQNRDVLLLFNALNHTSNQLLYLEQLSYAISNVEKALLLGDFYRSRQATIDTLDAAEAFVS